MPQDSPIPGRQKGPRMRDRATHENRTGRGLDVARRVESEADKLPAIQDGAAVIIDGSFARHSSS